MLPASLHPSLGPPPPISPLSSSIASSLPAPILSLWCPVCVGTTVSATFPLLYTERATTADSQDCRTCLEGLDLALARRSKPASPCSFLRAGIKVFIERSVKSVGTQEGKTQLLYLFCFKVLLLRPPLFWECIWHVGLSKASWTVLVLETALAYMTTYISREQPCTINYPPNCIARERKKNEYA